MFPSHKVVAAARVKRSLNTVHQIAAGEAARGGAAAAVGGVALLREEVLDSHLGGLRDGKLSLAAVGSAENVRQGHAGAALGVVLLENRGKGGSLEMRLHGGESGRGVVLQREVAQTGQLVAREGTQTRRVGGGGDGRMVGRGGEGVMREGGRRGRRRVGRVGARALNVADGAVVMVVAVVVTQVGAGHVVGAQAGRVAARVAAGVVGVMAGRVSVAQVLALDLMSSLGEHGNVAGAVVVADGARGGRGKRGKRVWRRDVGRAQRRGGRRANRLGGGRRSHQTLRMHVVRQAMVNGVLLRMLLGVLLLLLLALVTATRVWVVVNPRVAGELVGARELFAAAGELAGVRLLAGVGANVSRLVLETVKGLVAERALVGTRQLGGRAVCGLGRGEGPVGLDDGDGSGSHVSVVRMDAGRVVIGSQSVLLLVK